MGLIGRPKTMHHFLGHGFEYPLSLKNIMESMLPPQPHASQLVPTFPPRPTAASMSCGPKAVVLPWIGYPGSGDSASSTMPCCWRMKLTSWW
jgi:hypothetical protein